LTKKRRVKLPSFKTETIFISAVVGLLLGGFVRDNPLGALLLALTVTLLLTWYEAKLETKGWHAKMEKSIDSDPNEFVVRD